MCVAALNAGMITDTNAFSEFIYLFIKLEESCALVFDDMKEMATRSEELTTAGKWSRRTERSIV